MSDDVVSEAGAEIAKAWRAGMQVAEFMARDQQRKLARAQRQSAEDERRLRQIMEGEKRLAQPVYLSALDRQWWETATPSQAARVHSVATRFSELDPQAQRAAAECVRQARDRWGIDMPQARLTSEEVDAQALRASAPALAGEEEVNWAQRLDESAHAGTHESARSEAVPGAQSAGQAPTDAKDPFETEQDQAVAWWQAHYPPEKLPEQLAKMTDSEVRDYAHLTWACMAAEGTDLDNPPRIGLEGEAEDVDDFEASVGAGRMLSEITGAEPVAWEERVEASAVSTIRKAWIAEQQGQFLDVHHWHSDVLNKGSQAVEGVPGARLTPVSDPGHYGQLARRAAHSEAQRAEMEVDDYLDSLTPLQRRAVIVGNSIPNEGYESEMGRMAAYRIATARANAEQAERAAHGARARTDTETAEANEALTSTNGMWTARVRAEDADARRALAQEQEIAWDSHAARQEWADMQLQAGTPPPAVRAAVTGQTASHEPAFLATRPPAKTRTRGRAPVRGQKAARRQQQHR